MPTQTAIVMPAAIGLNMHLKPINRKTNPEIIFKAELITPENPSMMRNKAMMVAQNPIKKVRMEMVNPG